MKCISPTLINDPEGNKFYVPCGRCAWCLKRKRDAWVFRLRVEKKDHMFSRFLTLTYDDEHLFYNIDESTGLLVPSVTRSHVRQFLKSLYRMEIPFRYMICSEYGPKTNRPHYHGVFFSDVPIDYTAHWKYGVNNTDLPAEDSSLKYIVKYMLKGSNVPEGALPNFHSESRQPGLGASFEYKGEPYILDKGGVKLVPGHYYRRNYLKKLDSAFKSVEKESIIDYLLTHDPFDRLRLLYEKMGIVEDFDTWLRDLYQCDLKSQIKINSKKE